MLAETRFNHRLAWWKWTPIVAVVATLSCMPAHGNQKSTHVEQHPTETSNDNLAPKESQLWKLQEPSGTDWYIQMEGFEGRIVEGGGGVVLDVRPPEKILEDERAYATTFGIVVDGGFPEWIRAYRFDPDANEFDGSWYGLSVDTESGEVVVREFIDVELAAEIRRKAPGVPVLLPRNAKVWRIVVNGVQRPSIHRAEHPDDRDNSSDKNDFQQRTDAQTPQSHRNRIGDPRRALGTRPDRRPGCRGGNLR